MKNSLGAKTIVPTTPVWVVGTYDKEGKPNVMTVAWGGICCSQPPCIYVSLRKATYTYNNIIERKAFTVSIPSETYAKEARSEEHTSELQSLRHLVCRLLLDK